MSNATEKCKAVSPERCDERHTSVHRWIAAVFGLVAVFVAASGWSIRTSGQAADLAHDLKTRVAVCESNHKDLKEFMESKFKTLRDYSRERRDEMRADQEELMAELTEQRKVLDKLLERRAGTD